MAVYILTINGVERELRLGSLSWDPVINGADVASFTVLSPNRSYVPALGDTVLLTENAVAIVGGLINEFEEEGPDRQPTSFMSAFRITVDAFNIYFQGIYITETWVAGTTMEDIATDIVDNYLDDYGVSLDPAQATGAALAADLVFDGVLLSDALKRLTAATGYFGRISPAEEFRILTAGEDAAPVNIVDGDGHHEGDISVLRSRDGNQPNIIIVKYGPNGPLDITDTFTGDGVTDTFTLSQPLLGPIPYSAGGSVGYSVVDYNGSESLGGLSSPMIWLYDPVAQTIFRQLGPVVNGDTFTVRYTAQFPQTVTAMTSPAFPPVTRVYVYPAITSKSEAQALADSLLAQAQADKTIVTYKTRELGIQPGQTQTITAADRGVSGSFLIFEVHASNSRIDQDVVRKVSAIQGTQFRGSDRDIYTDWLEKGGGATSTPGPTPSTAIPGVALLRSIVRITDAQLRAAGAGGASELFLMVAGPAANDTRVKPIALSLRLDTTGGAYGNINPDYAGLDLICGLQRMSCGYYNDSATPVSKFAELMGLAHDLTVDIPVPAADSIAGFVGSPQSSPASEQYVMPEDIASLVDSSAIDGASVYLRIFNSGAGAFTGGNGANGAKATLYYVLEDMAPDWDVLASLVVSTSGAGHLGADAVTPGINTTGASFIVVVVGYSVTEPDVVDNKGNTYQRVGPAFGGFAAGHAVFVAVGTPTVGTNHIFTAGAGFAMTICVAAFTGVSPAEDDSNSATSASASALSTGSVTPIANGALLIAAWSTNNNTGAADAAIDTGFQILENEPAVAVSRVGCALAYLVQPTAAAINPQWSQPGASAVAASVTSFV